MINQITSTMIFLYRLDHEWLNLILTIELHIVIPNFFDKYIKFAQQEVLR